MLHFANNWDQLKKKKSFTHRVVENSLFEETGEFSDEKKNDDTDVNSDKFENETGVDVCRIIRNCKDRSIRTLQNDWQLYITKNCLNIIQ